MGPGPGPGQRGPRALLEFSPAGERDASQCFQIQVTLGPFHGSFRDRDTQGDFWPERRLSGSATSFIAVSHIAQFNFVSFVAYGWITRRSKMESKKTGKKKEVESLVPLCGNQKVHYKTKIEPLVKKKFFFTSITQLGWLVNMVISITFRMEGRMSRWKLINSEKLLICLPKRKKSQSHFTKKFPCTI